MSERYKPRRLIRERVERIARGDEVENEAAREAARRRLAIEDPIAFYTERERRSAVVLCKHTVNWLTCQHCSKPNKR